MYFDVPFKRFITIFSYPILRVFIDGYQISLLRTINFLRNYHFCAIRKDDFKNMGGKWDENRRLWFLDREDFEALGVDNLEFKVVILVYLDVPYEEVNVAKSRGMYLRFSTIFFLRLFFSISRHFLHFFLFGKLYFH